MDQLHALRRAGGPGGVDQREHVARLDLRDARPRRRSPGSSPRPPTAPAVPSGASPSTTITCSRPGQLLARLEHLRRGTAARRSGSSRRRRRRGSRSARGCRCCRSRTASRRASSPARSQRWNSGRLQSISAIVSPRLSPSSARPPASASTRSRSSPHVIVKASSLVRIATWSARSAAVMRNASASVGASAAARALPTLRNCRLHVCPPRSRLASEAVAIIAPHRRATLAHTCAPRSSVSGGRRSAAPAPTRAPLHGPPRGRRGDRRSRVHGAVDRLLPQARRSPPADRRARARDRRLRCLRGATADGCRASSPGQPAATSSAPGRGRWQRLQREMFATVEEVGGFVARARGRGRLPPQRAARRRDRASAQAARQREELAQARARGIGEGDLRALSGAELQERVRVAGAHGAPPTRRTSRGCNPPKLLLGLAGAVESLGVNDLRAHTGALDRPPQRRDPGRRPSAPAGWCWPPRATPPR